MSRLFFNRLALLLPQLLASLQEDQKSEAEKEFERLTSRECDDAARTMSRHEFEQVAAEAIRRVSARKKKPPEEAMVYA